MLKPLLPSIPSKELLIEGKFYTVYEQVQLYHFTKQTILSMQLANHTKRRHIKIFPLIKDTTKKDRAIHLYIEDLLTEFHDYIEKHYVGDRFVKIDSLPKPKVQLAVVAGHNCVTIRYRYKRSPESIVRDEASAQTSKYVGMAAVVTQADIDTKLAEVQKRQQSSLEQFKTYVEQKRKVFREQVDKEIAERDSKLA